MTQSPPFTLSARLSHLMKWTEEEVREEKEKGRKDHAKIVEARPGVIYLGPQLLSPTARSSKGWGGGWQRKRMRCLGSWRVLLSFILFTIQ